MNECIHSGLCNPEVAQQFLQLAEEVCKTLPIGNQANHLRVMATQALEDFEKADHEKGEYDDR